MKIPSLLGCLLVLAGMISSCQSGNEESSPSTEEVTTSFNADEDREQINRFLDEWHDDAAHARPAYFEKMAENGIYIGTDKTELWKRDDFRKWARKYFDQGKGWDFDRISRNIYFSEDGHIAWFDELLDTWMGDCRGSGVLSRQDSSWKIEHYHLSVTVPNDTLQGLIDMVQAFEAKDSTRSL